MRKILLFLGVGVGLLIVANQAKSQSKSPFIYGDVKTVSGDTYTGIIKWGTSGSQLAEMYWVEMFNGNKSTNDFLKFLSKKEIEELSGNEEGSSWLGLDLRALNIWEDRYSRSNHQFDTRFGDIKSIEPNGRRSAKITLKNGVILEVKNAGTYEDIGTSITVVDYELGDVKLSWDRLEKVDFKEAPAGIFPKEGKPIIAKVNAGRKGTFTGLIQWDSDERFSNEIINGSDRNGKREIPLRSIRSIAKRGNGVDIVLNSGRELYLSGSNDVNSGNRGTIVHAPEIGYIKIPWRDFYDMEIIEDDRFIMSYNDFPTSKGLTGTVVTVDGEEHEGLLAYDLDEAWEFEILNANDDNVEFEIPFRNIKSIVPKNYNYSMVFLKNGESLLLGGSRDVSDNNDGVLVFTSNTNDPVFIKWSQIDEVIFD